MAASLAKVMTCWVGCIVVFACSGRRVAVSAAPGNMFTLKSFLLIQLAYRTGPDGGALVIKAFRSSAEAFNSLRILTYFFFERGGGQNTAASLLMHNVFLRKMNGIRNKTMFDNENAISH